MGYWFSENQAVLPVREPEKKRELWCNRLTI